MNALTPSSNRLPLNPVDLILLRHFAQICEALDLPPFIFKQANERYEALGSFLCDPSNPFHKLKPKIYVQGSTRLQTTVKPPAGEEFDIDLICEFLADRSLSAVELFEQVRAAIAQNPKYAKMITIMNRCIRITYANEFYMDITPAVFDQNYGPENIRITDRPANTMKASNPKDYSDWFAKIASMPPMIWTSTAKTTGFEALIETRAGVEPVSEPKAMRPVLNRIVQIFKRHRDIRYLKNFKNAPISAIITTTAAHAYLSLAGVGHNSLYDLILAIAEALPSKLGPATVVNGKLIYSVQNPANPEENYADKWQKKPERQDEFFLWQAALVSYLKDLRTSGGQGGDVLHRKLAIGFGDKLVTRLEVEKAQALKQASERGTLGITTTGILVSRPHSAAPVRPQTFHC